MSAKGQDNQKGINYQNKVALLHMLDHYRYANFERIEFEGDSSEDFALFFLDSKGDFIFCNYEAKNLKKPLSPCDVRKIIKKEIENKGRYSKESYLYIVAPSFGPKIKEIKGFKERRLFDSIKYLDSLKETLKWDDEEISFLKNVHLIEIKEEILGKMISTRLLREEFFFYANDNLRNIISCFHKKISEKSAFGKSLKKADIESIFSEFRKAEMEKSDLYNLDKDLGKVITNIEYYLTAESKFKELNKDRCITPISGRPKAVIYITEKLKQRRFPLDAIKWFIEKVLIKERYFFCCLKLLEQYTDKDRLSQEDKDFILNFIFKIYESNSHISQSLKNEFTDYYNDVILGILIKLVDKSKISKEIKYKIIKLLDGAILDWQVVDYRYTENLQKKTPSLLKTIFGYDKEGLELAFKKHNFTVSESSENRGVHNENCFDYIRGAIKYDFKKNFPLIIRLLSKQFQDLYHTDEYGEKYSGYETSGILYTSFENNYSIPTLKMEEILSDCISCFYNETKDWSYLKSFIDSEIDIENPIFVKHSFIPFLLKQLPKSYNKDSKSNKFYLSLMSILKTKGGTPSTEDVLSSFLVNFHSILPDRALYDLVESIFKYPKNGINHNIFQIQALFRLIECGKIKCKPYLKNILTDDSFKKTHVYDQSLRLLASKMADPNIECLFFEIQSAIDFTQNIDLAYRFAALNLKDVPIEKSYLFKIFKSSSEKDLSLLTSIIEKSIFNPNGHNLLERILDIMKDHLSLKRFYERASGSNRLKMVLAQVAERLVSSSQHIDMVEQIIDLCINDTNLCGESKALHDRAAMGDNQAISTMRSCLCYTVSAYINQYIENKDNQSLENLEKAINWTEFLLKMDSSSANKIEGFPKPNYYLRYFATMPLITLAHCETRKNLNMFKKGLGDRVKQLALFILETTDQEVNEEKYKPVHLFNKISHLFYQINDLNEEEASKILSFAEQSREKGFSYFFIHYYIFFKKSEGFESRLKAICEGPPDQLKVGVASVIYEELKKEGEGRQPNCNFDFFKQVEEYWILLFKNMSKEMYSPLLKALSILLENEIHYDTYKNHLFCLIKDAVCKYKKNGSCFLNLDRIIPAVVKNNPSDLIEILFLFLNGGDDVSGDIPFNYEVRQNLIPQIETSKNNIPTKKYKEARDQYKKYDQHLK